MYGCPTVLDGVGTSDHKMVLLVPSCFPTLDTGWSRASLPGARVTMNEQCLQQRCHVPGGSICTHCLRARNSLISSRKPWTIYCTCFPYKIVSRHSTDKPWSTDGFRHLIRQRQRARVFGDTEQARRLRNLMNRSAPKLRHQFYQSKIATLEESSTRDW